MRARQALVSTEIKLMENKKSDRKAFDPPTPFLSFWLVVISYKGK